MWECNAESGGCDDGVVDHVIRDDDNEDFDGVVEDVNQVPVILAAIIMVLPGMVTKMVPVTTVMSADSG